MTPADINAMIAAAQEKLGAALRRRAGADRRSVGLPPRKQAAARREARRHRADGLHLLGPRLSGRHHPDLRVRRRPDGRAAQAMGPGPPGQQIAIAAAKVGVPAGSVDDAVRASTKAGATARATGCRALSHRTGHGIGMEVHEPIYLVHGETTPLAPGMCFSDEPGDLHSRQVRGADRGLLAHDRERAEILHPAAAEHRPAVRLTWSPNADGRLASNLKRALKGRMAVLRRHVAGDRRAQLLV